MDDLAISEEDRARLQEFRAQAMDIQMGSCDSCHEKWFDISDGKCKTCQRGSKFQESNAMYPGPDVLELPELTQMEEMMIARVHTILQVWQVNGGQFKYSGHCCNFPRDTDTFHTKLPLLPSECDVIVL
ncbi:hypothetical protein SISNIDRAFT_388695, partial [Sistotremastrum niveocremeum HHB9708]